MDHVPAVAPGHQPPDGGGAGAAHDDRHPGLLGRPGQHLPVVPVEELTLEVDGLPRPGCGHGVDVLVGPGAAVVEGNAESLELLLQPTDAEAEHQPAPRQVVDRAGLLGQVQRVDLGQDVDPGAEADGGGGGRGPGDGHQRVDESGRAGHRQLARGVVGIAALVAVGHDHVLEGPHRLVAEGLQLGRHGPQRPRLDERAAVERHHPHLQLAHPRRPPCDCASLVLPTAVAVAVGAGAVPARPGPDPA